ncbi:hypothetical protein LTR10_021999 [Elasticomyces elasticus]|uniref:Uncharacterized protein n=1 Tax=Exophiala sideris TaxID=1016849 RepID=A0ABR0IZI1_9EURO|nr:hypothetical protein LTR10_021999 [Elasticomyces elasticus]KAK5022921.1 hypothetical protein LTS07_009649 [Exophiala sideris]KAK5026400.1 hypothetical protein LTR13_010014 [Exophiala sideris]KAK5052335.1 hypothetical protein LTR69_009871 [Exophiala sideris]KAK5177362.1 hypothetical protein LTR44_010157 [Eurotiomycetes sp. CCFEE 6388]
MTNTPVQRAELDWDELTRNILEFQELMPTLRNLFQAGEDEAQVDALEHALTVGAVLFKDIPETKKKFEEYERVTKEREAKCKEIGQRLLEKTKELTSLTAQVSSLKRDKTRLGGEVSEIENLKLSEELALEQTKLQHSDLNDRIPHVEQRERVLRGKELQLKDTVAGQLLERESVSDKVINMENTADKPRESHRQTQNYKSRRNASRLDEDDTGDFRDNTSSMGNAAYAMRDKPLDLDETEGPRDLLKRRVLTLEKQLEEKCAAIDGLQADVKAAGNRTPIDDERWFEHEANLCKPQSQLSKDISGRVPFHKSLDETGQPSRDAEKSLRSQVHGSHKLNVRAEARVGSPPRYPNRPLQLKEPLVEPDRPSVTYDQQTELAVWKQKYDVEKTRRLDLERERVILLQDTDATVSMSRKRTREDDDYHEDEQQWTRRARHGLLQPAPIAREQLSPRSSSRPNLAAARREDSAGGSLTFGKAWPAQHASRPLNGQNLLRHDAGQTPRYGHPQVTGAKHIRQRGSPVAPERIERERPVIIEEDSEEDWVQQPTSHLKSNGAGVAEPSSALRYQVGTSETKTRSRRRDTLSRSGDLRPSPQSDLGEDEAHAADPMSSADTLRRTSRKITRPNDGAARPRLATLVLTRTRLEQEDFPSWLPGEVREIILTQYDDWNKRNPRWYKSTTYSRSKCLTRKLRKLGTNTHQDDKVCEDCEKEGQACLRYSDQGQVTLVPLRDSLKQGTKEDVGYWILST